MSRLTLFVILWLCCAGRLAAQHSCVVADSHTRQPIFRASLYSKEKGAFRSAITDAHGRATLDFSFRRLTVSHLNYEKKVLTRLADTIFLTPRDYLTEEVVVRDEEPAWLRPMLRRFARERKRRYYSRPLTLDYQYDTQSISARRYYRYESQGHLRAMSPDDEQFAISQRQGVVTAVDTSRLTDLTNLRRMLYEDFVQEFSGSFIRSHRFYVNEEHQGPAGTVELAFRSRRDSDDRGRFVIDTVRCVVLRATRKMGVEFNTHHRLSKLLYVTARALSGYKITAWDTDYSVTYAASADSVYYPSDIGYKFYFRNTERHENESEGEFVRQTGGGFANMEARLHLSPTNEVVPDTTWTVLPRHYYIRLSTDEERQKEVELSHMPSTFRTLPDSEAEDF